MNVHYGRKGLLGQLPETLLGHLWPSTRLIQGLRVAKWVRNELHNHATHICLSQKVGAFRVDGEDLYTSLNRWRNKGAQAHLSFTGDVFLMRNRWDPSPFGGLLETFPHSFGAMLTHLNLSSCGLADAGVDALAAAVKDCKGLVCLLLNSNEITDESAFSLATELNYCVRLSRLEMSNNFFRNWIGLLASLLMNCKALQLLDLGCWVEEIVKDSHLPADTDAMIAKALAAAEGTKRLLGLDVSCYAYEEDDVDFGGMMLKTLGHEECQELAFVLGLCRGIQYLDLSWNGLGEVGFTEICSTEGLARCTELEHLNASNNWISDGGIRQLSGLLRTRMYSNLKHLLVPGNRTSKSSSQVKQVS